jgi:hypothetical protein
MECKQCCVLRSIPVNTVLSTSGERLWKLTGIRNEFQVHFIERHITIHSDNTPIHRRLIHKNYKNCKTCIHLQLPSSGKWKINLQEDQPAIRLLSKTLLGFFPSCAPFLLGTETLLASSILARRTTSGMKRIVPVLLCIVEAYRNMAFIPRPVHAVPD